MRVTLTALRPVDAVTVHEQRAVHPVADHLVIIGCIAVRLRGGLVVEDCVPAWARTTVVREKSERYIRESYRDSS